MQTAQIILRQLGGNRFIAMTGAKDFVSNGDALRFSLPRGFACNKADRVVISLTADDLYRVEFFKWNARKLESRPVSSHDGIYCDMLRRVFTAETGLDCTL